MASRFEWVKLWLENIKVVVPLIIMLCAALGYTVTDNIVKNTELDDTKHQVTAIANHLGKVAVKPTPTIIKKYITTGKGCIEHEKEYHR
jgi:hypothetical protein